MILRTYYAESGIVTRCHYFTFVGLYFMFLSFYANEGYF